jgi:hypothetical protein
MMEAPHESTAGVAKAAAERGFQNLKEDGQRKDIFYQSMSEPQVPQTGK